MTCRTFRDIALKTIANRLLAVFAGLLFSATLLVGIETCFFYLNSKRPRGGPIFIGQDGNRIPLHEADEFLGYRNRKNLKVVATLNKPEGLIYQAHYTTDEYGRRRTPVSKSSQRRNFLLFFGCSFTFGTGVNDHETLPFYVGQLSRTSIPYNYGLGGGGPHQMLAKLESGDIRKEIKGKAGKLIYVFIFDHIQRAIGSMRIAASWGSQMPYYTLEGNSLIRKGNFTTGRPLLSVVYSFLIKSQTLKYFKINFPLKMNSRHIKLFGKIIEASRDSFKKQFGTDEFYVAIYPSTKFPESLKRFFDRSHIKYLDYSKWVDFKDESFRIKVDGHPSPKAHAVLAERLVKDLGIE